MPPGVAMSENRRDLAARLVASKLVTEEQVAQARAATAGDLGDQKLLDHLVRFEALTAWQAKELQAGQSHFFLGSFKLLEPLPGAYGHLYRAVDTGQGG